MVKGGHIDGRRFSTTNQQFGNFKDTSLHAASRAKKILTLREKIEQSKMENATQRMEEKEREEREAAMLALKAKLRKLDRQQRHLEMETRREAAELIQFRYSEYKRRTLMVLAKLMYDSAVKIQCFMRGWKARQKLIFRILLVQTVAAIGLQSNYRMYSSKLELKQRKQKQFEIVVSLQSFARKLLARIKCERRRKDIIITKVQMIVRSYFAQERATELRWDRARRRIEAMELSDMQIEDENSAAYENMVEETTKMHQEDMHSRRAWKYAILVHAEKQGIPLLPWRRSGSSLREIVQKQHVQRRHQLQEQRKKDMELAQQVELSRQQTLERIESERKKALERSIKEHRKHQAEEITNLKVLQQTQRETQAAEKRRQEEQIELREERKRRVRLHRQKVKEEEDRKLQLETEATQMENLRILRLEQMEAKRLKRVRKRGVALSMKESLNRAMQEKEEIRREAEKKETEIIRRERDAKIREERLRCVEQKKKRQALQEEKERLRIDEETKQRKEELALKARNLRHNLIKKQSAKSAGPKSLQLRKQPRKRLVPKNKRQEASLPRISVSVTNCADDPLSRALEWKRSQREQMKEVGLPITPKCINQEHGSSYRLHRNNVDKESSSFEEELEDSDDSARFEGKPMYESSEESSKYSQEESYSDEFPECESESDDLVPSRKHFDKDCAARRIQLAYLTYSVGRISC